MKMTTIGHREMPHISLFIVCKNGGIKNKSQLYTWDYAFSFNIKGNHIFVGAYWWSNEHKYTNKNSVKENRCKCYWYQKGCIICN